MCLPKIKNKGLKLISIKIFNQKGNLLVQTIPHPRFTRNMHTSPSPHSFFLFIMLFCSFFVSIGISPISSEEPSLELEMDIRRIFLCENHPQRYFVIRVLYTRFSPISFRRYWAYFCGSHRSTCQSKKKNQASSFLARAFIHV
jgi:hypothetical protein